jgi:uncharacterized protein (DUF983 family)
MLVLGIIVIGATLVITPPIPTKLWVSLTITVVSLFISMQALGGRIAITGLLTLGDLITSKAGVIMR